MFLPPLSPSALPFTHPPLPPVTRVYLFSQVSSTLKTLMETLDTPSEAVQRAVSQCLPALCKAVKVVSEERAEQIIKSLRSKLFDNKASYAVRRGAAFGLAGAIKGFGLMSFKQYGIMDSLEAAASDPKNEISRCGAMFAFECCCDALGMLFEPYVIRILPSLLKAVGELTVIVL